MAQPRAGACVGGRYRLAERVGRGAMGDVWRATVVGRSAPDVALKLITSGMRSDPRMLDRFAREARAARAVQSPHVCALVDEGHDPGLGLPFLVFELVHGETFEVVLKRERTLALDRLRPIIDGILRGVSAAHDVGVVHRDLKPSNVMIEGSVDGRGSTLRVRVLDFGVAKILAGPEVTLTSDGAVVGSVRYMPPEQLAGGAVSPSWDLYAVGTLAFRALTGKLPFAGHDLVAMIATKSEYDAPSLGEVTGSAWPPTVEAFFRAALACDPRARFTGAEAMRAAWHHALDGAPRDDARRRS